MYSIALVSAGKSFLPDVLAYEKYFSNKGAVVKVVGLKESLKDFDVCILFHGLNPFWKSYPGVVIGEYHSLSTGKNARLKDMAKRLINIRSNMYLFLNDYVRQKMWFGAAVPHIIRPMGFFSEYVDEFRGGEKEFDIVYSGSVRAGVDEAIIRCADIGLKVALVGGVLDRKHENVISFGKVTHRESYSIMSKSRIGLNFCPDKKPWSRQDSTKLIEYCASGLGVITNSYSWVVEFEQDKNASFLDFSSIESREQVLSYDYLVPDVTDLSWESILEKSALFERIAELVEK